MTQPERKRRNTLLADNLETASSNRLLLAAVPPLEWEAARNDPQQRSQPAWSVFFFFLLSTTVRSTTTQKKPKPKVGNRQRLAKLDETNDVRCDTIEMACLVRVPKIMHDDARRKEFE
ncbi:hypothetical protein T458_14085 [Brevibacillus panacihumi W25]|uniref:Uncharacterized protein n=1 Tax=Brevibacillus panacihumi W25 TaxID=1408254 RepID=V6M7S8_9BACL|nr:hypothetical protein T458_14085 [Brevibacillus panacihumi W25]